MELKWGKGFHRKKQFCKISKHFGEMADERLRRKMIHCYLGGGENKAESEKQIFGTEK